MRAAIFAGMMVLLSFPSQAQPPTGLLPITGLIVCTSEQNAAFARGHAIDIAKRLVAGEKPEKINGNFSDGTLCGTATDKVAYPISESPIEIGGKGGALIVRFDLVEVWEYAIIPPEKTKPPVS